MTVSYQLGIEQVFSQLQCEKYARLETQQCESSHCSSISFQSNKSVQITDLIMSIQEKCTWYKQKITNQAIYNKANKQAYLQEVQQINFINLSVASITNRFRYYDPQFFQLISYQAHQFAQKSDQNFTQEYLVYLKKLQKIERSQFCNIADDVSKRINKVMLDWTDPLNLNREYQEEEQDIDIEQEQMQLQAIFYQIPSLSLELESTNILPYLKTQNQSKLLPNDRRIHAFNQP